MEFLLDHPWLLGLLTSLCLACVIEVGRYTSEHLRIHEDAHRKDQMTALRDGLFVLIGLLVGFTLALAASRYADRRVLLVDEANSIRVSYLRAETLAQPNKEHAQPLLRQYLDLRLEADNAGLYDSRGAEANRHAGEIQEQLWADVVEITKTDRTAVSAAYMNSVNEIINLHEKRTAAEENRIPFSVWLLIFSVSVIAIFTRGLTLSRRFWLTVFLAPVTIAITVTLIADLDTTSTGLIRLDQRPMLRVKADINAHP